MQSEFLVFLIVAPPVLLAMGYGIYRLWRRLSGSRNRVSGVQPVRVAGD